MESQREIQKGESRERQRMSRRVLRSRMGCENMIVLTLAKRKDRLHDFHQGLRTEMGSTQGGGARTGNCNCKVRIRRYTTRATAEEREGMHVGQLGGSQSDERTELTSFRGLRTE